ncbi:DNA alkylation repair protein [Pinibacter aurantiacus]|uniref:DNA alkylation repair protein n=1 Tax=Pinibacter aurantiacus TaxID=2851599 RepID=A0A9E2S6J2_9BACT|nr:DNA alkylation repair protein [Pinibacter aurantiacus]MBV4356607.1 DNA alkylation repair protein [Pinibacter aurantiacus]
MKKTHPYLQPLQELFEENANKTIAEGQSAYMRNMFSYYGLKTPERRMIFKEFIAAQSLPSYEELPALIKWMWQQPQREWQYIAIELAAKMKKQWKEDFLELIEYCITTKSWWDSVDAIATDWAGNYFMLFPKQTQKVTARWNKSDNMWLQRVSMIFQLQYKLKTDEQLLFKHCKALIDSKEFFIQKGMGWALRQYARHNMKAVQKFVDETKVSNLTKREALKHA